MCLCTRPSFSHCTRCLRFRQASVSGHKRSTKEHGTVRCRWSERLNGSMQGDTLDMALPNAHRFLAMTRAVR